MAARAQAACLRRRQRVVVVGAEARPGCVIKRHRRQRRAFRPRQMRLVVGLRRAGGQAARQGRGQPRHLDHAVRVERHYRDRPGVVRQQRRRPALQRPDPQRRQRAALILDLHQQRRAPRHQRQNLGQRRDRLAAAGQRDAPQFGGGARGQRPVLAGQPVERGVVEHHRLAIGGKLDVQLHAISGLDGGENGRAAVLHAPRRAVMQAAMRQRRAQKRRVQRHHATSKIPSISTATPNGSDAPTAERA